LSDGLRQPDEHNPQGYFEYEPVKKLAQDSTWLEAARGRALKVVYPLLKHLPPHLEYRVLFMQRDLLEVFESQRQMLLARHHDAGNQDRERLIRAFSSDIRNVRRWLAQQRNFKVLEVPYSKVVHEPGTWAHQIAEFLDGGWDESAMARIADTSLYHHRRQ
jgi:hypothetical protein